MEEVWKDINLITSLQDPPTREEAASKSSNSCFRGMILEDFLARPTKETTSSNKLVINPPHDHISISLFASTSHIPPPPPSPPPPPPPPVLSLSSSTHEYQYQLDAMASHQVILNSNAIDGFSPNTPFNSFQSFFGQKKETHSENGSTDRRHKRMIKNRESAARSRARKQAYTNELELEVEHLMEENAKLRKQQKQLCLAAASAQLPPKRTLYRTATAPF